jgi:hypothetical protein
MTIVYEPQYAITGWLDNSGYRQLSWFWRDLTNDVPKTLNYFFPAFYDDPDDFLVMPPITVQVFASFFDDADLIFTPSSIRALVGPDQTLKNEIRRIR